MRYSFTDNCTMKQLMTGKFMKNEIRFYYTLLKSLIFSLIRPGLWKGRKLDFMIIGAQKSGTTALDSYLRFHPELGLPVRKELHHFNNERICRLPEAIRNTYYHRFFPDFANLDKLLGESTPNYMMYPHYMDRIHAYNPALKLVVILRDPVSRAYSHWNMQRDKIEYRSFEGAVMMNLIDVKNEIATDYRFTYLQRGEYARQLKYVTTLFPREQVLVLFQQDLRTNPLDTMNRITQFLGVSPFRRLTAKEVHRREYPEPMSDSVKNQLKAHYLPHIEELEQFMGKDLSHWK